MRRVALHVLTAVALAGCASSRATTSTTTDGSGRARLYAPDAAFIVSTSVPAAKDLFAVEMIVLDAPRLPAWPRSMRAGGPRYLLAQYAPYVGQFGVLADGERADDGSGFSAVFGRRAPVSASKTSGYEVVYESSAHFNAHSQVDGAATRVGIGMTRGYNPQRRSQRTYSLGVSYHLVQFDDLDAVYDIAGFGGYASIGLEWMMARRMSVRLDARAHVWSAEDGDGHGGWAETASLALGMGASF